MQPPCISPLARFHVRAGACPAQPLPERSLGTAIGPVHFLFKHRVNIDPALWRRRPKPTNVAERSSDRPRGHLGSQEYALKKSFITTSAPPQRSPPPPLRRSPRAARRQPPGPPREPASTGPSPRPGPTVSAFGLDQDQGLTSRSVATDKDGTTHVRFDRTFKGLPVVGGDLVVHTDKAGAWKGSNAASTSVRVASTTPTVAPATAAATAARTVDYTVERIEADPGRLRDERPRPPRVEDPGRRCRRPR